MDEQALVALSKEGDLKAFNQLVELHQGQVYNLAYRMLGSPAPAEDVAQETFISAFQHLASYRGGSFKSWLLRIATNGCYDHLRSVKRQRSSSLDSMMEEDPSWEPASKRESPEECTLRGELSRSIRAALDILPPDQRAVLILSDIHGLAYEEVAQATGASLGTVKSRLSRARAHLRGYFAEHGELLPSRYRQEKGEAT